MPLSEKQLDRYERATTGAVVVWLQDWTTIRVTGRDRAAFLHNMCTNDIRGLIVEPQGELHFSQQTEAFLTDVKGKIVGHVVVFAEKEQLLLLTVPAQAERIIPHLERYIIREDVQLVDETAHYEWGLEIGARALGKLGANPLALRATKPDCLLAPCTQIWPGGLWLGYHRRLSGERNADQAAIDDPVWQALRIESGWPLFGVDFDESNLPQEVGRDAQAISFRKGCYLGQETIARIDALGHVNKRLATVRLEADAPAGAELVADGQAVGALSSVSWSPRLGAWLALAMVRRGHNEPGAKLECQDRPAEVVTTPAVAHLAPGH
jgi:folate-binding protein YgfZ